MKRTIAVVIAALMLFAFGQLSVLGEAVADEAHERAMLGLLDEAWAPIEEAEAEALSHGAGMNEVTLTVYKAVLQNRLVDAGSIESLTQKGFRFRVSGMLCCYDYVARNTPHMNAVDAEAISGAAEAVSRMDATRNGPFDLDILLIGPFYGQDANFTNQYRNEAQSIADVTGGSVTVLSGDNATGPAIAAAFPDAGVVLMDSHGADGYLCLTTAEGITSEDYANDWASNAGDSAYIDGRYIQHHVTRELPNSIVWMAMCEGMKLSNHGSTGYALLEAGAGCVYGYSQAVTFGGEYRYEAHFWNNMKYNDTTVAEAFNAMTEELGDWDPLSSSAYGAAWPVIMSPVDPYPSDPDSHQTVHCDWKLFGAEGDPVALESFSLSPDPISIYQGVTSVVRFERVPDDANDYTLAWASADESIATVAGNDHTVRITGVEVGQTSVACTVYVGGEVFGTASCTVNVVPFPGINEALNVEGGSLDFTSTQYPWQTVLMGERIAARSGNAGVNSSTSTLKLVLDMQAGETLTFDWMISSERFDKMGFFVNNTIQGSYINGDVDWATVVYTAPTTSTYTFEWRYIKDVNIDALEDGGFVDNVVYSGMSVSIAGDVDGNGAIESTDALLALRISLGIIQPTAEQLHAGDIDGNGTVEASDALIILRMAMGIIS